MDTENTLSATCTLDRLENDCLIHIFSFLPIIDRIRIERVSKRWRTVSRISWKTLNCINIKEYFWGIDEDKNKIVIDYKILRRTLKRCGQFITHIDLCRERDSPLYSQPNRIVRIESCKKVFSIIHEACPNIVSINMGYPSAESAIEYVANNFANLTHFTILFPRQLFEDAMSKLFLNCKKLKYVDMLRGSLSGDCLLNLNPESVEEFFLYDVSVVSQQQLGEALERLNNLQMLSISTRRVYGDDLSNPVLKGICINKERLQNLEIDMDVSRCSECIDYSCIKYLENLETLNIGRTGMASDYVLKVFASSCTKLIKISIDSSDMVTDGGIADIINLPNLQYLSLSSLHKVTDKTLGDALGLKELHCQYCRNIKDEGIAQLIYKSQNIESIILYNCPNVSVTYLNNLADHSALSKLKVDIDPHRPITLVM